MDIARNCMNKDLKEQDFTKFMAKGNPLLIKRFVQEPAGHITLEDFPAGSTVEWTYWHDEVHVVVKGKAQVEYYLPPLFQDKGQAVLQEGDAYLMHRGECVVFKVLGDQPFRHLCVIMPAVPMVGNEQMVREIYYAHTGRKLEKKPAWSEQTKVEYEDMAGTVPGEPIK